uniref:hypothetical protein n=1 Tax=Actinomadura sp. CA-154981 TaxID=3240037 RepID=UPI003F49788A
MFTLTRRARIVIAIVVAGLIGGLVGFISAIVGDHEVIDIVGLSFTGVLAGGFGGLVGAISLIEADRDPRHARARRQYCGLALASLIIAGCVFVGFGVIISLFGPEALSFTGLRGGALLFNLGAGFLIGSAAVRTLRATRTDNN